jgi:hypothetical protein
MTPLRPARCDAESFDGSDGRRFDVTPGVGKSVAQPGDDGAVLFGLYCTGSLHARRAAFSCQIMFAEYVRLGSHAA